MLLSRKLKEQKIESTSAHNLSMGSRRGHGSEDPMRIGSLFQTSSGADLTKSFVSNAAAPAQESTLPGDDSVAQMLAERPEIQSWNQ